ncbi:hypothetical protein ACEUZ9_004675 [Paracoccus litorisediminis]|uniref:hypothetical protein n=1 Tax=Paracoccus litorisediminis TaxID=2006130 RepID=UPI00372FB067
MQDFLHPNRTDNGQKARVMRLLGRLGATFLHLGQDCVEAKRPEMRFGREDAAEASRRVGANCGPMALAAITGRTPLDVLPFIPRWDDFHFTTEVMMAIALYRLGHVFAWQEHGYATTPYDWPSLGLVRIAFEGPWSRSLARQELLKRSHWIATSRDDHGRLHIYDVNIMVGGGWRPYAKWRDETLPFIAGRLIPGADGRWRGIEQFDLAPWFGGSPRDLMIVTGESIAA